MLYREIIAVCSQIHTKHVNTLCGQNVELLNVQLVVYQNHISQPSTFQNSNGHARDVNHIDVYGPNTLTGQSRCGVESPWLFKCGAQDC